MTEKNIKLLKESVEHYDRMIAQGEKMLREGLVRYGV
jgi:hypothetical protein